MVTAPGQVTELRVELGDEREPDLVRWTTLGVGGAAPSQGHHAYALRSAAGVVLIDPEVAAPAAAGGRADRAGRRYTAPHDGRATGDQHPRRAGRPGAPA